MKKEHITQRVHCTKSAKIPTTIITDITPNTVMPTNTVMPDIEFLNRLFADLETLDPVPHEAKYPPAILDRSIFLKYSSS
ncbi:MAG: hypothetical protein ACJA0S_000457 [Rickettsiales bacterium]